MKSSPCQTAHPSQLSCLARRKQGAGQRPEGLGCNPAVDESSLRGTGNHW